MPTALASFNGANGARPLAGLFIDGSGNLYGTTSAGARRGAGLRHGFRAGPRKWHDHHGGLVRQYPRWASRGCCDHGQRRQSVRHHKRGEAPPAKALSSSSPTGSGTIVSLASFNYTNGEYPSGGLIIDSSGNLYGTAPSGGSSSVGTVFELVHGSGTITHASFVQSNHR